MGLSSFRVWECCTSGDGLYIKVDGVEYKYTNPRGGYLLYLVTSEQMQEFDRFTIQTLGVPGIVLMEHAGKAAAAAVLNRQPKRAVVVCGKGNNGGDGWIAARWLMHWGVPEVVVVTLTDPASLVGDAKLAAEMAKNFRVPYVVYTPGMKLPEADVFVDALLGTGITRPLSGTIEQLVEQLNQISPWTIAMDVPTGVNASTGEVYGTAVKAQQTVCMAVQKLGTAVTPGCYYAGEVQVVDIGICTDVRILWDRGENAGDGAVLAAGGDGELASFVDPADIREWLPRREAHTHKGSFGRLGVVAGPMAGASILAGLGAARCGAGLVVLGGQNQGQGSVPYEFVQRRLPQTGSLLKAFDDCQALVVGPGLAEDYRLWPPVFAEFRGKGVLDADGLRMLQDQPELLKLSEFVLTPHPKECARLLAWTTQQVQQRRLLAARTLAQRTQCVVVLKGFHSVIAHPQGTVKVNPTGNAALATAGSGDVLAGMIGSLMAQGLDAWKAAQSGCYLHGLAGELAGAAKTLTGSMASDVVENIAGAIHQLFDPAYRE